MRCGLPAVVAITTTIEKQGDSSLALGMTVRVIDDILVSCLGPLNKGAVA